MTQTLRYILRVDNPAKKCVELRKAGYFAKLFPDPERPDRIVVLTDKFIDGCEELGGNIIDEYYRDRLRKE